MEALQRRRHWDCEKDGEGSGWWGGGGEAGRTGLAGVFGCPATQLGSPGRRASPPPATPCSLPAPRPADPGRDYSVFIIPRLSCAARSPAVALQLCINIIPSRHLGVVRIASRCHHSAVRIKVHQPLRGSSLFSTFEPVCPARLSVSRDPGDSASPGSS